MEIIESYELTIGNCLQNVRMIGLYKPSGDPFLINSYTILHKELYRHGWFKVFSPEYFKTPYGLDFTGKSSEEEINQQLLRFDYYSILDQVVAFREHRNYVIEPFGYIRKVSNEEYEQNLKSIGFSTPWKEMYIYNVYFYFLICLIDANSNRIVADILNYHERKFTADLKPKFRNELRLILRDKSFKLLLDDDKLLTVQEWIDTNIVTSKPKQGKGLSFEVAAQALWEVQGLTRGKISDHPLGAEGFFQELAQPSNLNGERLRKNYATLSEALTTNSPAAIEKLKRYTSKIIESLEGEPKKRAIAFIKMH